MRIALVRHAEAKPGMPDHERSLTVKGERDARTTGSWLRLHVWNISAVVCSTAIRARRTWELAAGSLPEAPEPTYSRFLYQASAQEIIELASTAGDDEATLVIVGHNPAIEQAASLLSEQPFSGFPAGAAAVFDVTAEGSRLVARHGR